MTFLIGLFSATIRITIPILLAALGGLVTQQVGIINIALEGFALLGAFATISFSYFFGNTWLGVLSGVLTSSLLSLVFGLLIIKYKTDEIITGIGINILASGITLFLLKAIFNVTGAFSSEKVLPLPKLDFPLLKRIPFWGPILNNHTPLVYLSLFLIPVIHYLLFLTPFGLIIRGVGNNREAAKTAGVNVNKTLYIAIVISGALCGLAGAHISTGYVTMFSQDMIGGRGFIAFIAILFGNAKPVVVSLVCIFFGFVEALSYRLQQLGLPSQLVLMIPYIMAVLAVTLASILQEKRA